MIPIFMQRLRMVVVSSLGQRRAYGRYSAASLTLSIALPDVIKPFFMLPLLTVPGRRAISSVYGPAVWLSRTRSRYWCGASWS